MKYEMEPMGVGQLLDRSLRVTFANFGMLLAISLFIQVPAALATEGLGLALGDGFLSYNPEKPDPALMGTFLLFTLGQAIIGIAAGAIVQGSTTEAVARLYMGEEVTVGSSLRAGLSSILPLVGLNLLLGMAIVAGTMCFVVGAFFVVAAFAVCIPALILERRGPYSAMERSWHLTKGHRWRMLGTLGVAWMVSMVWAFGIQLAAKAAGMSFLHQTVLGQVAGTLVMPFYAVIPVLLFFDLRIRKEAYDLQVLAREAFD